MKRVPRHRLCNADRNGRILKTDQSGRISAFRWTRRWKAWQRVKRLSMLSELEVGTIGIIESVDLPPSVHNHLMYMGFLPNARVEVLHRAPAGDPTVYGIDGLEIALRRETAQAIQVHTTRQARTVKQRPQHASATKGKR